MTPKLLLYNLKNSTGKAIEDFCKANEINVRYVSNSEWETPLEKLIESEPLTSKDSGKAPIDEPMLLFCYFGQELLTEIIINRDKEGLLRSINFKAGLTPTNSRWTSTELFEELVKEHKEMNSNQ